MTTLAQLLVNVAVEQLPAGVDGGLAQYGAIGLILLVALFAIGKLFTLYHSRQVSMHERDIARADKAEAELAKLNEAIRDQFVAQLVRATDACSRVLEMLAEERRAR